MPIRTSDIIPISEARARLTELAEDVVGRGSEKVLTKNGSGYVALVAADKLDYYHALEADYGKLVLLNDAIEGLEAVTRGETVDETELDELLHEPLRRKAPGRA